MYVQSPKPEARTSATLPLPHGQSEKLKAAGLHVEHVDVASNLDRISHDYREMWEYDPGEERAPADSDKVFRDFLSARKDVTAVAAFRTHPGGEKEWVGSAFGYGKRRDQPLEPAKQAAIASVYVDPSARKNGVATAMVEHLKASFSNHGYKGVQLYASPEGRAVYSKVGFTDGDEMRHKLRNVNINAQSGSIVKIRRADLADPNDARVVIAGERTAGSASAHDPNDAAALAFLTQSRDATVPPHQTAFIAYRNDDGREVALGSTIAGVWKYPVPNTFADDGRRDLFVPGLRVLPALHDGTPGTELLKKQVYLKLAQRLLTHAQENRFTQVNVQRAGDAREELASLGYQNGIHMEHVIAENAG